jgi:DnaJ-class molecular chaperone
MFGHMFNHGIQQQVPTFTKTRYYEILGLERGVSIDQIHSAYKKLALQYHPDKNPNNEEKFKEINKAKEFLSDPKKKQLYDTYGDRAIEISEHSDTMMDRREQAEELNKLQKNVLVVKLKYSLSEYYNQSVIMTTIKRKTICRTCQGVGYNNGKIIICAVCSGSGSVRKIQQYGPGMLVQTNGPCHVCNETGSNTVSTNHSQLIPCTMCCGKTFIMEDFEIKVDLKYGLTQYQISNDDGNEYEISKRSSIIVDLGLRDNELFEWHDHDLLYKITLDISEALFGFEQHILHPNGTYIKLISTKVTKPNTCKYISDMGMPYDASFGKLIITFDIIFPDVIDCDEKMKLLFKSTLSGTKILVNLHIDNVHDLNELNDYNVNEKNDNCEHECRQQ